MKANPQGGRVRLLGGCVIIGLAALVAWTILSKKSAVRDCPSQASKTTAPRTGVFQAQGQVVAVAPQSPASVRPAPRVPAPGTGVSGPPSTINGQSVAYSGAFSRASVTTGGKTYDMTPNQIGFFGRIDVEPGSTTPVRIYFPQGNPGDTINVVVEDGGHLDKDQMAEVVALGDSKTVAFDFTTTDQAGIYRIALRDGADVKVLNFWVGPEPRLRD